MDAREYTHIYIYTAINTIAKIPCTGVLLLKVTITIIYKKSVSAKKQDTFVL